MASPIAYKDLENLDVLLQRVSSSTGLSEQSISDQLLKANIRMFAFEDNILISPDDLDSLIDSWADNLKTNLKR